MLNSLVLCNLSLSNLARMQIVKEKVGLLNIFLPTYLANTVSKFILEVLVESSVRALAGIAARLRERQHSTHQSFRVYITRFNF